MFCMLLLFCVGSVCAADTDNTTVNDNHSVDNVTNTHVSDIKQLEDKRDKLGLEIKQSETTTGKFGESIAANLLSDKGFSVQRMSQNHPFDFLINGIVKIDVKTSRLYKGRNGDFYTFNLGKKYHSCDFFLLLELDDDDNLLKSMLIPTIDVMEINQISCGIISSVYDKYIDCFFYINNIFKVIDIFLSTWTFERSFKSIFVCTDNHECHSSEFRSTFEPFTF